MTTRDLLEPFATSIFAKKTALERMEREVTKRQRQRILESISDDLKKASNFHPHKMSVKAWERAQSLENPVDLAKMTWHEQHSFDPGRVEFIVEHKNTVSSLRDKCLRATDEAAVLDILVNDIEVVWILRSEDEELTRLKYRSKRPDADAAYADAMIEIWAPTSISTYDQCFLGTTTPGFRFQSVSTNGIPRGRSVSSFVHFSSFARHDRNGPNQPDFVVSLMS